MVAKYCLANDVNMVTSDYLSPEMQVSNQKAGIAMYVNGTLSIITMDLDDLTYPMPVGRWSLLIDQELPPNKKLCLKAVCKL